jgi:hypothetical protein
MSKQRAFVKYTKSGRIIPGSLIIGTRGGYPNNGLYTEVPTDLCCGYTPFAPTTPTKTRAFVKYTKKGKIIPGSLILTTQGGYPVDGLYLEVSSDVCCNPNPNFFRVIVPLETNRSTVGSGCAGRGVAVTVYMTQECLSNPQVGCLVLSDAEATTYAEDGDYIIDLPGGIPGYFTLTGGIMTAVEPC